MPQRPPLSYRELKDIQEGHRRNPDVIDLLREVKRLRELVASAYAAMQGIPMNQFKVGTAELIALSDALRAEPAVQEYIRVDRKRKELEFKRQQAQERSHVRQDPSGETPT